jgi:large subunit ribosomal protein L4
MASISYIGSGSGSVEVDDAVFGEDFHEPLVHRAVTAELNARRQGTHSTLTRGEVAMTGAKAWRQKGTGRARAGALSSPQRTGGGIAFGPKPRSYTVKVNRKERRRALRSALSVHVSRGSLAAVDPAGFDAPSTKSAAEALAGFTPFGGTGGDGRALVVLADGEENAVLSFRNIDGVTVLHANAVGVADVIGAARLVASPTALEHLTTVARAPGKDAADSASARDQSPEAAA